MLYLAIIAIVVCIMLLYFLLQGPIFVPTLNATVQKMLDEITVTSETRIVDLGSGDGRIVIAFAQKGAQVVGYEINPLLVWYSRFKIHQAGVGDRAKIVTANFWSHNLEEFNVVVVFGIGHIMQKLSGKLIRELKPGAVVVSNAFHIPGLREIKSVGSLLLYQKD